MQRTLQLLLITIHLFHYYKYEAHHVHDSPPIITQNPKNWCINVLKGLQIVPCYPFRWFPWRRRSVFLQVVFPVWFTSAKPGILQKLGCSFGLVVLLITKRYNLISSNPKYVKLWFVQPNWYDTPTCASVIYTTFNCTRETIYTVVIKYYYH